MNLTDIRKLVASDLADMDQLVAECLQSEVPLVSSLSRHLIESGGKQLRPLIVLLGAYAFEYRGRNHIELAAVLELIHAATLLHDDVIDSSELRRGKKTSNVLWGNAASVLVGDFLYSRAFQLMVRVNNERVLQSLSKATNTIASGEILQLINRYKSDLNEELCFQIIRAKTGMLFATAAQQGAILTHRTEAEIQTMVDFGMHFGVAFQLIDDSLDYCSNEKNLGKNRGDDLSDGKMTLPLVYALKHGNANQSMAICRAVQTGNKELLDLIVEIIKSTGALAYVQALAKQYMARALNCLERIPNSSYCQALMALTQLTLLRNS